MQVLLWLYGLERIDDFGGKAMDGTLTQVYVYGFKADELERWARDFGLQPVALEPAAFGALPDGAPVVVHASAAAELTRRFELEGVPSDIILFLPSGAQKPRGAYYEAAIAQEELPRLRALVTHPEQFRMRRLAEDIPLRLLTKPIQALDLQQLGLPERDAVHLANCAICPDALREALRNRVRLYQRLSCPSPEELITYARTDKVAGGQFSQHIQTCPLCEAQLQALRAVTGPALAERKALIEVPAINRPGRSLRQAVRHTQQDIEDLRNALRAAFGPLLDLFDGVWTGAVGWQIAGVRNLKGVEPGARHDSEVEKEALSILQEVHDEQIPVILSRGRQHLYLGWDAEAEAPYLETPSGSACAAREFSVELMDVHTGALIWSAKSKLGRLVLHPADVEGEFNIYEATHPSQQDSAYKLVVLEES